MVVQIHRGLSLHKMIVGWVVALGLFTAFFMWVMPKDDLEAITTYHVDAVTLDLTLRSGEPGRSDESIWRGVVALLPSKYLSQHVKRFHVFSDGTADTLAYVNKASYDPKAWVLAVDRTDYRYSKGFFFTSTIIHEFAHILALEDGQIGSYHWKCDNFSNLDGCFKADSYLNQWYQQFWAGEIAEKHRLMLSASTTKADRREKVAQFYQQDPSLFVSEYASTDAVEDFAESFAHYVLNDEVTDKGLLYARKMSFFSGFPELVHVREYIRSRLID